jgi:hypothetical protein
MFQLPQALRHGFRSLGHTRGLAVVAILSLGVAVNVAVFAVVYAVLVRPLPHPDADRLVAIWSRSLTDGREHQMAPLDFFDFERQSSSFDRIAAYYLSRVHADRPISGRTRGGCARHLRNLRCVRRHADARTRFPS